MESSRREISNVQNDLKLEQVELNFHPLDNLQLKNTNGVEFKMVVTEIGFVSKWKKGAINYDMFFFFTETNRRSTKKYERFAVDVRKF